jgi:predicted TIM-barrel fold metal-dependent hydrolase
LSQVRDCLGGLTPEERRKVLSTNAARVYNLALD